MADASFLDMKWMNRARDALFPPRCLSCGDLVQQAGGLCGRCWTETPILRGLTCDACGAPLLGPETDAPAFCDPCRDAPRPWAQGRAVLRYAHGGRRLVLALKHGDRLDLAPALGRWMALRAVPLVADDTLVVPVPLHRWRLLKRRYNQAAVLAQAVAREIERPCLPDLLQRRRATPTLDKMSPEARHAALAGAIAVTRRHRGRAAGRAILLIDDVMTSGATLISCAEACLAAGARRVDVTVLARAARDP